MNEITEQDKRRKFNEMKSTLLMIARKIYKGASEYFVDFEEDVNKWKVGWVENGTKERKYYFTYEPDLNNRIQLFRWVGDNKHSEINLSIIKKYLNIK